MSRVEIEVKFSNLGDAKKELLRIASEVGARKLDLHFSNAEGEAVEELIKMSRKLQSFGQIFADVVRHTAEKLDYTSLTFKDMDESLKY